MTIGRERARRWQYWKLEPDHELCLASDEAYAEGFREVFTEAVRCRLRSAYPPGVMLSGGLDSSSVACVARQLYTEQVDKPIKVFTAIFPGLPQEQLAKVDEREYAVRLAVLCPPERMRRTPTHPPFRTMIGLIR